MQKCDILGEEGCFDFFHSFLLKGRKRVLCGNITAWEAALCGGTGAACGGFECFFVLGFHGSRQRCFHYIAEGADVVAGNPLPEAKLLLVDNGVLVRHFHNGFELDALWHVAVGTEDDACVNFAFAERHNDSATSHHSFFQFFWDEVCEVVECNRKYDVGEHLCRFTMMRF